MVLQSSNVTPDITPQKIFRPVEDLSRGFFSDDLRHRMRHIFYRLVKPCFRNDSPRIEQWNSELCSNGTPIEFGFTLYDTHHSALRFVVDTQCRPGTPWDALAAIERDAPAILPSGAAMETVSRVARRHLKGAGEAVRTYVFHSARCESSQDITGRLYLNCTWRSRRELETILYENLRQHTPICLNTPLLGDEQILGAAYDFGESGVSRFKLYLQIDRDVREKVLAIAVDLLGERALLMGSLLDGVNCLKDPGWCIPPTLLGLGLSADGRHREVKLTLPAMIWEWDTYDELRPVLFSVLSRWGRNQAHQGRDVRISGGKPSPLFRLTQLCIAVSTTDESFTVYFRPLKSLAEAHLVPLGPSSANRGESLWRHDALDGFFSNYCL